MKDINNYRKNRQRKDGRNSMNPPNPKTSSREERENYIKERFQCKGNCDICGFCAAYHGLSAEIVYKDYIDGKSEFAEAAKKYR